MCLEFPVELVDIRTDGSARGLAEGRTVEISLLTLDEPVSAGDWVVAHAGFALHRITSAQARAARRIREETP